MPAKRILALVGDYVEDYEIMVPFQALIGWSRSQSAAAPAWSPRSTQPSARSRSAT